MEIKVAPSGVETPKDVLGEEPIGLTPTGLPIYAPEENDYQLRDRINQEKQGVPKGKKGAIKNPR